MIRSSYGRRRRLSERGLFPWLAVVAGLVVASSVGWTQQTTMIVDKGDQWRFFRGRQEPPTGWNDMGFDDSAWETGPSGFGYGDNDDATLLNDMQNNYVSVYIRRTFDLGDPSAVKFLQLGISYDDGYVAFINGIEISRSGNIDNGGLPVPFDMQTSTDHEVNTTPDWISVPSDVKATLEATGNVLAIQGHNTSLTSSDFSLIPYLRTFDDICPINMTCVERTDGQVAIRWQQVMLPPPYDIVEIERNGELLLTMDDPARTAVLDPDPLPGENTYTLVALIGLEPCGDPLPTCTVVIGGNGTKFRRGDSDGDGQAIITDAVYSLLWLYQGGVAPTCKDAADADDDGDVAITDAVYLLLHLYQGGPAPPAPGISSCGADQTDDDLGDCVYPSC